MVFDTDEYIKQIGDTVVNPKAGIVLLSKKGKKRMVKYNLVK